MYSRIRKNADINKTLKNINYFAEYSLKNHRKFGITACAMKDNVGEWSSLVNLANELNADIWFSEVFFPFKNALWTTKYSELKELFRIAEVNFEKNENKYRFNNFNKEILKNIIQRLFDLYKQAELREKNPENYCLAFDLAQKLKKQFANLIKEQPDKWIFIEEAILSFENIKILDLSLFIERDFDRMFVFDAFSRLTKEELTENFGVLLKT